MDKQEKKIVRTRVGFWKKEVAYFQKIVNADQKALANAQQQLKDAEAKLVVKPIAKKAVPKRNGK